MWSVLLLLSVYEEGSGIIFGVPIFRNTLVFTLEWPGSLEKFCLIYTATKPHL